MRGQIRDHSKSYPSIEENHWMVMWGWTRIGLDRPNFGPYSLANQLPEHYRIIPVEIPTKKFKVPLMIEEA